MALSAWDNEGSAGPRGAWADFINDQPVIPERTNTELVQLRVRVIALENLVIALLANANATDQTVAAAAEMAAIIAPRPGATHHPLTTHAATQMTDLVGRAAHFRSEKL